MRESEVQKRTRVLEMIERLRAAFPQVESALNYSNPLQCLISTILSAQCTDARVNLVTPGLFRKYPDADAFAAADRAELENDIRSTGFFRNKAKSIQNCCRMLVDTYQGKVPETMDELVALQGVGRKTANCVLGNAYGKPAIMVDTHVKRLSFRLGFTQETNPDKIEFELKALIPEKDWTDTSHGIILHGRKTCMARKPKCDQCILLDICPQKGVS
jgi:endonuclease III